jgi:hypothetical protein
MTGRPARQRPGGLVAGLVAGGVVAAGLTGSLLAGALVGDPGTVDAVVATAAPPPGLHGPGSDVANVVAARPDVETLACRRDGARHWLVVARATNPTDRPVSYRLALRVAAAADGDVVGRAEVETGAVPVGGSADLRTRVAVSRPPGKANCVFVAIDRENSAR